jgi:prophage antirepressor-like protein
MDTEIKDTNCIVKAFENNSISILEENIDNKKTYWFKAGDIGNALGLSNINVSVQNYDIHERGLRKAYTPEGGTQNALFLTSHGVYRLLYNSKKDIAKKFRKWVGDILDDIIFNNNRELLKQLQEKEKLLIEEKKEKKDKEQLLKTTQHALEAQTEKMKMFLRRRYYKNEPCCVVYVYKNNIDDEKSLIKIGKTNNISIRENDHNTSNQSGEIVYVKKCYNNDLLEKVVHHILDKHRIERNKEWFDISLDVAKNVIDCVQLFLDEFIPYSENLNDVNLYDILKDTLELFNKDLFKKPDQIEHKNIYQIVNERKGIEKQKELEQIKEKIPEYVKDAKNPLDFNLFMSEYCELGPDYYCLKRELQSAHKLWSRNAELETRKAILKFFAANFETKKVYFEEYKSTLETYQGIRLKSENLIFKPQDPNNISEYEQFIMEKCKLNYTSRISYKTIIDSFEKWKELEKPLNIEQRKIFQHYLNNIFFPATIYASSDTKDMYGGGTNTHGIWGVTLKDDISTTGLKLCKKLKKNVVQIDIRTNEIINKFNSVTEASKFFGYSPSVISTDIKFGRIRNNCVLKTT